MIDDLSDVSSLEQMITYIQYVDPVSKSVQVDFLCIANLLEHSDSADSKTGKFRVYETKCEYSIWIMH